IEQLLEHGATFRLREVERQRTLAAVHRSEVRGIAGAVERRAEQARLVAHRRLDLDHVGTVVGQHLRAERPGQDAGKIDDANAVQRAHGQLREGSSTMPDPTTDCSSSWLRPSCAISTRWRPFSTNLRATRPLMNNRSPSGLWRRTL